MTRVQALNSTDLLADNLAALREFQPDVAELVARAEVPTSTVAAIGRDGSDTFRLPDESGKLRWLGSTSMPSISAAELFGNVRRDQGSVLVPGVGSGREPLLVAERLESFSAVFVVERSAALIQLAMSLYDYRDFVRDGRIVFLCGESLSDAMVRFFEANPGYEYPGQLFHAPHSTPSEGASMREAVERAGQLVLNHHATLVQRLQDKIAGQFEGRATSRAAWESPRVALLSVVANDASVKSVSRVGNALRSVGWEYKTCIPDRPSCCHTVARLEAIASAVPDIVVFVNSTPRQSRAVLPASLPVVSWYLPGFAPASLSRDHSRPADLYVASTDQQERAIRAAGLDCLRVEPATDATVFTFVPDPPGITINGTGSVVVLMDIPADGAEEMNLTLPSQVALWEALRDESRKAIDRGTRVEVNDILRSAEKRSGTVLSDDGLRARFWRLIETVVAPASRARADVAALRATGRRVEVYGVGWQRENLTDGVWRGPVPDADRLCTVFQEAQTVLLPVASDTAMQSAIDALSTGAHVVIGADKRQLSEDFPGLCDVLGYASTCGTPGALAKLLPEVGAPRQTDAAVAVAASHTMSDRLRQIVSRVQGMVASHSASGR